MKRTVKVAITKRIALQWYRGDCEDLKNAALSVFTEAELQEYEWDELIHEVPADIISLQVPRDNIKRLKAINRVMVVESIINKDWRWCRGDPSFTFENYEGIKITGTQETGILPLLASFKNTKDAEKALNILGSHTISVAMGLL